MTRKPTGQQLVFRARLSRYDAEYCTLVWELNMCTFLVRNPNGPLALYTYDVATDGKMLRKREFTCPLDQPLAEVTGAPTVTSSPGEHPSEQELTIATPEQAYAPDAIPATQE